MTDKAWKHAERRIAAYIDGERVPVSGRQRGYQPDINHAWMCPEVKYRKKVPEWLHDAMEQAWASKVGRQMPCVILIEKGQQVGDAFVLVPLSEFKERFL